MEPIVADAAVRTRTAACRLGCQLACNLADFGPRARDFGPWVGEAGVRLTGAVFVSAETVVNVAFDVARIRLAGLAGGWLAGASDDAYAEGGRGLARVGPAGSVPGLSRLVEVRFRDLVAHEGSAVMALRWEAAGAGGALFPVLDADLRLTPGKESRAGNRRPPSRWSGSTGRRWARWAPRWTGPGCAWWRRRPCGSSSIASGRRSSIR
jgi:hypothetical protein